MYHPSSTPRVHSLPKPTSSTPQFRLISLSTPTTLSLFAFFLTPNDAKAFSFSKDQITTSLSQVENTIDQVEEAGSGVLGFTQRVLEVVIDALKPGVDVGLPLLKKAGDQALEIASPAFSDASKKAQEAIQGSGIDTDSVAIAAKGSSLLLRPWSCYILIYTKLPQVDIRSEKDKNKAGIPRLLPRAKNKMISLPLEELPNNIKNIVRSTKKVEAEIAVIKISYLKRIGKGSDIVIMDSYSDTAKIVARVLILALRISGSWMMDFLEAGDGYKVDQGQTLIM